MYELALETSLYVVIGKYGRLGLLNKLYKVGDLEIHVGDVGNLVYVT